MRRHDYRQRKMPKAPAATAEDCDSSTSISAGRPPLAPVASQCAVTSAIHPAAIEPIPVASLRPHPGNARTHSKRQVRQIADSIRRFGFVNPVLIGHDGGIIAGHGRVEAAKLLGLDCVPTVRLAHLNATQRRAYILTDNKLALNAGWDRELLAIELQGLVDIDFDVELTGFSPTEIDLVLDEAGEGSPNGPTEAENQVPFPIDDQVSAVTRAGDVWCLGRHRLICGDARDQAVFDLLDERADLLFTDPPYNVAIDGHVTGLGRIRHREFAMGVGEMSVEAFTSFLQQTLGQAAAVAHNGAIAFVCMDWRHMGELLNAGQAVFSELKNLCVWNKTNGGMGTFYRSKHELVFVFKVGTASHTNTFGLGDSGRYRTNVWDYAGINTLRAGRSEDLAMHPTVKPVALVAEAIKDCSRRGEIVLDPFGGSGTTLIAAEKTGRLARLIEFDPAYCDTILRRFERVTGKQASQAVSGTSFEEIAQERAAPPAAAERQDR
jgi:DNA modification methylase